MICNHKGLAKTSGRPGKTQLINHFDIDTTWYLVDLPGYGYARVSKKDRVKWNAFTWVYLKKRENLMCVCVLIDGRIDPQKVDMEFMGELGARGIPFVIIFTKMEKVKPAEKEAQFKLFEQSMLETWEVLPPYFYSSATSGEGKEEILAFIAETNEKY